MSVMSNEIIRKVQWGDCDPAKIVFYPNYFRWFDEAANTMFASHDLAYATLFERFGVRGLPLVDSHASFKSPSVFGDTLTIKSHVAEWRRSTMVVNHAVLNDGVLAVEGQEIRIWVKDDPDTGKLNVYPIPDEIKNRFS